MKLFPLFKHKHTAPKGYGDHAPYGSLRYAGTDGTNIVHAAVVVKCATCGKEFDLVNLHFRQIEWGVIEAARKRKP